MNTCNICLDDKQASSMHAWHAPSHREHRVHASCIDCVALEVFTKQSQAHALSCPECRQIVTLEKIHTGTTYTIEKIAFFSLAFFSSKYVIAPMLSFYLNLLFRDDIDNAAIRWSSYGEPPLNSYFHTEYSSTFTDIRTHIASLVQRGYKEKIEEAISIYLGVQNAIARSVLGIVALYNIDKMMFRMHSDSKAKGIALQALHLLGSIALLNIFKVEAEDLTKDPLTGLFSTSHVPAYSPYAISKSVSEIGLFVLMTLGFAYLAIKNYEDDAPEPRTQREIKLALSSKSHSLVSTNERAF